MADFNLEKLEGQSTNQEQYNLDLVNNLAPSSEHIKRKVKPYQLLDEDYYSPKELAVGIAENWEEGIKHLVRGKISEWIKKEFNDNNLFEQILDIEQYYYGQI